MSAKEKTGRKAKPDKLAQTKSAPAPVSARAAAPPPAQQALTKSVKNRIRSAIAQALVEYDEKPAKESVIKPTHALMRQGAQRRSRRESSVVGKAQERPAVREAKAAGYALETSTPVQVRQYCENLRTADLRRRVLIEREGVPHTVVAGLIDELGASTSEFQQMVGMPKATFAKKIANKEMFSGTSGQSVIGVIELINKVQDMLDPNNPEARNFDVAAWVWRWIRTPQPALGGEVPAHLMDTPSGRQSVMRVLGALASGAYL